MAAVGGSQQDPNAVNAFYGQAGHLNPEASNLRSYVNRIADHLKRSDPNHPLRGYLEDCIHDLGHFGGKVLQSRDKTPNTPRLRAQDLILSFVTISERLSEPMDQLSLGHVDFDTFLADLRNKLFTSRDSMMSICSNPNPRRRCYHVFKIQDVWYAFSYPPKARSTASQRYPYHRRILLFDIQIREHLLGLTNIETDVLTPVENFTAKAVSEQAPFFLDLGWNTFDFEWCCDVPEWTWWFDMYVWVLHTTQPKAEMVTVYVRQVEPCWKVLLAYTQTQDVTYANARKFLLASRTAFDATPMDLESPEMITIHLILSIIGLLCDGNRKFRDSCFNRISQLRLSGRKRPSRHQINFLLHLDDHRQCAFRGLRRAKVHLKYISDFTKQQQPASSLGPERMRKRCDELIIDLENLEHDLDSLEEMLTQTRDMIKLQLDLEQISFSGVIALLAAIYLPFSFMAGLFGMNVKDPLWPMSTSTHHKTASESSKSVGHSNTPSPIATVAAAIYAATTSATPTPVSTATTNLTEAFIEALESQPGSYLFGFKEFWYIAVSVTAATIFLPLFAGVLFRATVQFSYNQKEVWMSLVFIIAISGSITFSVLEGYIAAWALGMPQAALASFILIRKLWKPKRARIRRWMVYASVLVACIFYDLRDESWASYPSISNKGGIGDAGLWDAGLWDGEYWDGGSWDSRLVLPSLAGIVGPLWLVGLWIWDDRPLLNQATVDHLYAKRPRLWALPRSIFRASTWITNYLKSSDPTRRRLRKVLYLCCFLVGCGVSLGLSLFLAGPLYVGLTFTFFGLYSVLKIRDLFSARRGLWLSKNEIIWWSFAVVVVGSDLLWWYGADENFDFIVGSIVGVWLGSPVLFPTLMLLAIHSDWNTTLTAVRQWCRGFRGASTTIPGDQGQQPAQGHQHV
nr:hypothetical protein LTR18_002420 [Exophiala xenobiotica]